MEKRLVKNLFKILELIDLTFTLKKAYLKVRFPVINDIEIESMVFKKIAKRKEAQWKSAKASLRH